MTKDWIRCLDQRPKSSC